MSDAWLADAMAMVVLGQCPNDREPLHGPYVSESGASRSLLSWYHCDYCHVWVAICDRAAAPHLLATSPGAAEQILAALGGGGFVFPQLAETEYNYCRPLGHLPAVRLN